MSVPLMPDLQSTILRSIHCDARWNFASEALSIIVTYTAKAGAVAIDADGREVFRDRDPFAALAWMERSLPAADSRWVGFIGYEFAREIERLPTTTRDDLKLPAFAFALCRSSAKWEPDRPPSDRGEDAPALKEGARIVDRTFSRHAYLAAVQRSLDYIAAGDVFQINLAQRLSVATDRSPAEMWRRLCDATPAEYGAFLALDDAAILCNSPELFFRIDPQPDGSRKIINRPIKGTRPNAPGMFDELSHSAKDRAELAMIVDLQRNDLGRVCEIGSVVVREPRVIEATPTVYHGVATIDGTLRRDASFADVIRALFPCGSITGCPKVRAMEIIDELEPVARGPYCGAIGYLAADGSAEFNVAIRTMVIKDGIAHVYVGGGIVADSSPEAEYEETLVKAKAMLDALGVTDLSS